MRMRHLCHIYTDTEAISIIAINKKQVANVIKSKNQINSFKLKFSCQIDIVQDRQTSD